MNKNNLAAENTRLQKVLSEKNKKIRDLEGRVEYLEEQVSSFQTQLSDAEKLIASLQATSLGVLEDVFIDDLHDLDSIT
jgi:predicted  nucleic acid-binding Zn-ribbon protein